ncbi:hypothetical protein PIB30_112178 [Stylosanthes scabra]|uniref:Uncharacterized protein n=1 Tax=Stylosanthes scabra TaxID=79078 RepID=A0ABU6W0N1_9FABA|nr:hypothetical protein [Stylosanthes scabra]
MQEPRYPLPRVVICSCGHSSPRPDSVSGDGGKNNNVRIPWRVPRRGFVVWPGGRSRTAGRTRPRVCMRTRSPVVRGASTMILPQVHLRKPCYDFSFL